MGVRVSIGISPRETFADWRRFCAEAERLGVDEMWLIDSQLAMKDVYAGLAVAAASTERMRLGTGVTNLVTRHPTVTANAIAAISELSDGRAALGIGAGDSAVFGLGARPSRISEVEAALSFFGSTLAGGEGTWMGRSYRLAEPIRPTPVYLAVSQERMCRLAGGLADGAIVMGPAQPELVERQVRWIREAAASKGRPPGDVQVLFVATLSAREDTERALADVRSWASAQARLQADLPELPDCLRPFADEILRAKRDYDYAEHLSTRAAHQSTVSDELVRTLAIAGSTQECVARLDELLDTGIDDCIFPLMGRSRIERIELLSTEILPHLRPRTER